MPISLKRRKREAHKEHFLDQVEQCLINNEWNQKKLCARFGKTQSIISRAIKQIVYGRWKIDDRTELENERNLRVKQHEYVQSQAMNAWHESKKPKIEVTRTKMPCGSCRSTGYTTRDDQQVECTICNGTGIRIEETIKKSKSCGDTSYLATAQRANDAICKLRGLYPERKIASRATMSADGTLTIDTVYENASTEDLMEVMVAMENLKMNSKRKMLEGVDDGDIIEVEAVKKITSESQVDVV